MAEIDDFIVDMGGQYSINDLENRVMFVVEATILLLQYVCKSFI